MKKLNFETSKGKFVVVDEKEFTVFNQCTVDDKWIVDGEIYDYNSHSFLKDITEQQASEIVEEYFSTTTNEIDGYFDYRDDTQTDCPIESVHSLITSNGYYLFENPNGVQYSKGFDGESDYRSFINWKEAQDKTFFNPIIFKLV